MYSQTEVFTSSRGYRLGISNTDNHHLNGWIEILLGRPPIKIPFQSICSTPNDTKFNFCSFVQWSPYFDEITSVISGLYSKSQIHLKWVMTVKTAGEGVTIINHGTDKLVRSTTNTSSASGPVPHPFNLEMLNISSDLIKIETIPAW